MKTFFGIPKLTELSNLEELKQRREELLLQQEVARLERKQALAKSGQWSWVWVAPVTLLGAGCLMAGLSDGLPAAIFFGVLFMAPAALKFFFRR